MRLSKEALSTRVVVRRRTGSGAAPFGWEVQRDETAEPVFVSPDRFNNMAAAYHAGKARLAEFVLRRSHRLGLDERE